jgi:hypothetical protein
VKPNKQITIPYSKEKTVDSVISQFPIDGKTAGKCTPGYY